MQDRYAGDIGDFGKYGLLRALCGDDLRLGVLWYAFEGDKKERPNDGQRIDYLDPPDESLRECDPALFDLMHKVVHGGDRSIAAVERSGALRDGTAYHRDVLAFPPRERPNVRAERRRQWLASAREAVQGADVVFADPDTGLEIPSTQPLVAKGPKYAYYDDLIPYWEREQSLVIYQHATRGQGGMRSQITERINEIRDRFSISFDPIVLRWRRISARAYFILPAPAHADVLKSRVRSLVASPWGQRQPGYDTAHFERAT